MATVGSFTQLLTTLEQADFFIGVLPFLLAYLVFYAVFERVPVIEEKDNFPPLLAIIFAFFASYFVVQNPAYQAFFVNYLGTLTVGLIGLLGLFTVMALSGVDTDVFQHKAVYAVAVIVVAIAFTVSGGLNALFLGNLPFLGSSVLEAIDYVFNTGLIWAALILVVLYLTMGGGNPIPGEEDNGGG